VWCRWIGGLIILDDKVSAELYLKFLQDHFVPTLQDMEVSMERIFLQQDGARSHMANAVIHFLSEHFHGRAIYDRCSELSGTG
jgi:hypothetical protein